MKTLENRVAIITGAGRGLGKNDAMVLAREGATLALADIRDSVHNTKQEIEDAGGRASSYVFDLRSTEGIRSFVKNVKEEFGRIDILINNAANVTNIAPITKMDDEKWQLDVDVNLTAVYQLSKEVLPIMKEQNGGRIIGMASVAGTLGGYGQAGYSATKMGTIGLMKTLALEGARYGITANAIVPGIINTELAKEQREVNFQMSERMRKRIAMERFGEPDDISELIAFLVSERAGYITGQAITIAGGLDLFTF
ncbi:SDR family oxidoreductase [Peribacillus cavernae]|uniref:SDR family oxidoreductase n=1 Tax=Peribacillus cavernae TaxID=1674310 RepID=A0A3S0U915_9BACI|nr:SDR family NAD(P)-dependent oxidoreductase [Peribacillus cavernae]MDQ0218104.1 3-oxoacyl-[acyl-carrier protein] reductase [Peribacillus cavernae]RUQ32739.1 SDR family oxidoreductase [Peribacillus cavernae]